jgi:GNAT superfamily N-acetyltransferase
VVEVALLGEYPELIEQIGGLRWREWGYDDPSPARWTEVTASESLLDGLPSTLVAIDSAGKAIGAVALGEVDEALTEAERAGRAPWLLGLVVDPRHRGLGIGRQLVEAVEGLARSRGYSTTWVATGPLARDFYVGCGWVVRQDLDLAKGG